MDTADLDTVIAALTFTADSAEGPLAAEAERLRRKLEVTTWVLEVHKGGELYASMDSSDPAEVLRWAAFYRDFDTEVPEDATAVEAFEARRHEWDQMDISFTRVIKYRGDIRVLSSDHGEQLLVDAARQAA